MQTYSVLQTTMAVERGRSVKLEQMRHTTEVHINSRKMTQILVGVSTSQNYPDIFTNMLTSARLAYLLSTWFMLGVERSNNPQAVLTVGIHRHDQGCENRDGMDIGGLLEVACTWTTSRVLVFTLILSHPRECRRRAAKTRKRS